VKEFEEKRSSFSYSGRGMFFSSRFHIFSWKKGNLLSFCERRDRMRGEREGVVISFALIPTSAFWSTKRGSEGRVERKMLVSGKKRRKNCLSDEECALLI
jgi:hypothetical protein